MSDHFLVSAAALRTQTARYVAAGVFIAFGLVAEIFIKFFGNWLLLFRRFSTRLSLWLAVGGVSAYLGIFFYAQAEPAFREIFYFSAQSSRHHQPGYWIFPLMAWSSGVGGCLFYVVAFLEWLFIRTPQDRTETVEGAADYRKLFLFERVAIALLLLVCLPGFFIIFRSMWAPLGFADDSLVRYLYLTEKTVDAVTFGLLDAFDLHILDMTGVAPVLSSIEKWMYYALIGLIGVPLVVDIVRLRWGKGEKT